MDSYYEIVGTANPITVSIWSSELDIAAHCGFLFLGWCKPVQIPPFLTTRLLVFKRCSMEWGIIRSLFNL
jgi:hypothetical protein